MKKIMDKAKPHVQGAEPHYLDTRECEKFQVLSEGRLRGLGVSPVWGGALRTAMIALEARCMMRSSLSVCLASSRNRWIAFSWPATAHFQIGEPSGRISKRS